MKKVLLSAAALVAVLSTYAQVPCEAVGFSGSGIYEDFSAVDPVTTDDGGIYVWGDKTPSTNETNFGAIHTRNSGSLAISIIQSPGQYTPTGIGFGDTEGDGSGTKYTIDLSQDANFSVKVANDGDSSIVFRVGIQDINGKDVDTYSDGLISAPWNKTIQVTLAPNTDFVFSGDLAGAKKTIYDSNGDPESFDTSFDFSKVTAVMFTVVNANCPACNGNGGTSYNPYALIDYPISVTEVKVGACPVAVGLTNAATKSTVSVYPNPASEKVSFSKSLTDVTVFNALGNVIETAATSAGLNVSNYNAGIYFIKSSEGTTQFVVK